MLLLLPVAGALGLRAGGRGGRLTPRPALGAASSQPRSVASTMNVYRSPEEMPLPMLVDLVYQKGQFLLEATEISEPAAMEFVQLALCCTQQQRNEIQKISTDQKIADQKIETKDEIIAAKDEIIEAKDYLIESKDQLIEMYPYMAYQKDLQLSKHLAILHARSLIVLCAALFYKNDKRKTKAGGKVTMISAFVNGHVFEKGTMKLTPAADAVREILDGHPSWSLVKAKKPLEDDIKNIYYKLSNRIHFPPTASVETGWCIGGPGTMGAAEVIVCTLFLEKVGHLLPGGSAQLELVILDPDYQPFKKFSKQGDDGWTFRNVLPFI